MFELLIVPMTSLLALAVAGILTYQVLRASPASPKAMEIAKAIHEGSAVYLNRQYRAIWLMVIIIAFLLPLIPGLGGWKASAAYIVGASSSTLAGYIGMYIAIRANSRTAQAALSGVSRAFGIAFRSGLVTGMSVVGLGLLGVFVFYLMYGDPHLILPFSFGASTVALFARVGGGIYTKTADVGADLVGKVEAGIPEDDPRNPAVIADNIGDNVGDVAGMGADLFESYVASLVTAMVIGFLLMKSFPELGVGPVLLPLVVRALAILASALAALLVGLMGGRGLSYVLTSATILTCAFTAFLALIASQYILGGGFGLRVFGSILVGLIAGMAIGLASDYFTNRIWRPAQTIAKASQAGPAINILTGFSMGTLSTFIPIVSMGTAMAASFFASYTLEYGMLGGMYGVTMADVGMLSVAGMVVAADAYGPVVDNAAGIAEMAGMPGHVRSSMDLLDSVGNTTKAICKGFAIASAALTALALFFTYVALAGLEPSSLTILDPYTFVGLFIGCAVTALFVALAISAVGRNSFRMVEEVRRQFREIPGLLEGRAKPDYGRCVDIATKGALKELILPSLIALITPVAVASIPVGGKMILGGLLAGVIVTGLFFGLFMANAGGAWDNAKKYIELGHLGGKRTPTHSAAVIGDTVGDPFKDTAGPAVNILLKLMVIVSLHIIPFLA